ncbi:MAG: bifunctional diguanylate cyclase/phosphodiesterase [Ruminococcus sp.]|nr:bifunctional diguanylate cyclase/phosphodiesterase [Ruminococcus sp.]
MINSDTNTNSILATNLSENCSIRSLTTFVNFNEITSTWIDTLADNDCLIVRNENDMELIKKVNYPWYVNLKEAGVKSTVIFPLRYNNEVLGFIWATNFDTANTMRIKETLELTTFFISSKLSSYKMLEHLRYISYTDTLTGIPNRIAGMELVENLVKQDESFTVVSIDINGFKSINNTMGFETGNKVLKEIAARWKTIVDAKLSGTQDYIARVGGDEFALIIRDYRSDDEIIKTIKQYESVLGSRLTIDGCDFYISASFGYAVFPDDAKTSDNICSYANASMCEVKRLNSSNHIMRFTKDMLKVERTLEIERKLRTALEEDTVYYNLQPQFDLSHKLRGFEALARMKDSEGNNIYPNEFIPVAEKVGLVDKVDGTVFRKSAIFIGELIRRTGADITLSVNVSVRHLMKNDFLDEVDEVMKISGLPKENLEIEITESIMIDSADKALKCIEKLHEMGIKIAIDDFGTGYSSLSYLNKFPANLLKIDKSFIDKMNISDSSKQYVAAIISIGHIMGFDVISEGVEEQEQLETLREIGCDFIQGYIWGKPLPKEDAEKLVIEFTENNKNLK